MSFVGYTSSTDSANDLRLLKWNFETHSKHQNGK